MSAAASTDTTNQRDRGDTHDMSKHPELIRRWRRTFATTVATACGVAALAATPSALADEKHKHGDSVCDENHPAVQKLIGEVQASIRNSFPDLITMQVRGFIPYFDAMVGGYPIGSPERIGHWLNPDWIEDGRIMDPTRPESILTDEYHRPIGFMFIADENDPGPPVYVDEETGKKCSPWHPHTDLPATFSWWFYETVYGGRPYQGEVEMDPVTPMLLHVWAIPNDKGWAAHNGPEAKYRERKPQGTEIIPGQLKPGLPVDIPPAG